ncbi:hypothetical protein [Halotia branconii]|uniref:Uncharacterized protein n=1 Tax=Halotia branconii CENA392 TaxID=1539056 RepID=A0AAJ6P7Z6_9CYAN|nr:hypothetical protein [Halotia branconii]WGV24102.1 hypothetical protein QI031_20150 [Halotia branconii CENA392]
MKQSQGRKTKAQEMPDAIAGVPEKPARSPLRLVPGDVTKVLLCPENLHEL